VGKKSQPEETVIRFRYRRVAQSCKPKPTNELHLYRPVDLADITLINGHSLGRPSLTGCPDGVRFDFTEVRVWSGLIEGIASKVPKPDEQPKRTKREPTDQ
jgi:hypothetical protein